MIRRSYRIAVFGMLGLALGAPESAHAQRHARVHVSWEWRDAGHRAGYDRVYRTAWLPRVGVPDPTFLYRPVAGVRVPPGHRPRRGYCRLWYPGVAPGHQPSPRRCHNLRGVYSPGVLIVTWQGPLRPAWDPYTNVYWVGSHDLAWASGAHVGARGGYAVAYGGGYGVSGGAWWDAPVPVRARPVPRVRVPRVAHRGPGSRYDREKGKKGRGHPEARSGRHDRYENGPRGDRGREGRGGREGGRSGRRGIR
mgnify:FL=1|jgi:hypothetical protein